jgi:hypothetical protein
MPWSVRLVASGFLENPLADCLGFAFGIAAIIWPRRRSARLRISIAGRRLGRLPCAVSQVFVDALFGEGWLITGSRADPVIRLFVAAARGLRHIGDHLAKTAFGALANFDGGERGWLSFCRCLARLS